MAERTALEGDEQTTRSGSDVSDVSDGVLLVDKALRGAGIEGYLSNVCALLRPKVSPYLLLASLFVFIASVILSAAHCAAFAAPVPWALVSPPVARGTHQH